MKKIIEQYVKTDWKEFLLSLDDSYYTKLDSNLNYVNWPYYPKQSQIFRAFNHCNIKDTKVAILGQDPYSAYCKKSKLPYACGLAFTTTKGCITVPASLKNIYKELRSIYGENNQINLEDWSRQGVLLLNTILTIDPGKRNSHKGYGWQPITHAIVNKLQDQSIFLSWGKQAHKLTQHCKYQIITSHPSPLSATKTSSPFIGSKCFEIVNKLLQDKAINWVSTTQPIRKKE